MNTAWLYSTLREMDPASNISNRLIRFVPVVPAIPTNHHGHTTAGRAKDVFSKWIIIVHGSRIVLDTLTMGILYGSSFGQPFRPLSALYSWSSGAWRPMKTNDLALYVKAHLCFWEGEGLMLRTTLIDMSLESIEPQRCAITRTDCPHYRGSMSGWLCADWNQSLDDISHLVYL
jgi:hypothetical protein